MVVRESDSNTCTYSECGHTKCNSCETVMMSVPLRPHLAPQLALPTPPPPPPPPPEIDATVHDSLGDEGGYETYYVIS